MPKMHCMEAAVHVLEDEGVTAIFGMPGANINSFYAALAKSTKIKHYIARHEEGASHAAEGWARATGIPGVCVSTSGPSGTNFVTGLYNAFQDSIPLIAITGQHVRAMQGKEGFQAMDITEVVRPVTKKAYYVREPAQMPWVFRDAFRVCKEGRPGPVLIDLPIDVQRGETIYDPEIDGPLPVHRPAPDERKIRRAVEMLLRAERPILLVGGGAILAGACDEFRAFAEYLQIPVVNTSMAKGAFPGRHPLYAGEVGIQASTRSGNAAFLESDAVFTLGCRFGDRHTGSLDVYTRGRTFIQADVDPLQISRQFPVDLGIVGDAKLVMTAMLAAARELTRPREPDARARAVPELRSDLARKLDFDGVPIKPQRVFKEINEFFDGDTIFTTCIGLNQIWANQFMEIEKPGHFMLAGGAGPLGWDMPAAIGVKIARPDATVVNITGDYGFQFCMQEWGMACQYNVPIVVVVVNNGNMSLIRQNQKYAYNGLRYAIDIDYPHGQDTAENRLDFKMFSEAFGGWGERVTDPGQIRGAFERALTAGKPAIVDVIVERDADASMGQALDAIREFEPADARQPVAAR
ncbi:MAG TPA: thiamine pyrophosphate-dependent enzyme [Chloroflexota bacterium]|jgi:tartronate-semialdehyde synthase